MPEKKQVKPKAKAKPQRSKKQVINNKVIVRGPNGQQMMPAQPVYIVQQAPPQQKNNYGFGYGLLAGVVADELLFPPEEVFIMSGGKKKRSGKKK